METRFNKAGDMPLMVTAVIAAGRNRTIDYNAGQACDVVIKVFTCVKTAWNKVKNMFATVLTTITTTWRPGFTCLTLYSFLHSVRRWRITFYLWEDAGKSMCYVWPECAVCVRLWCLIIITVIDLSRIPFWNWGQGWFPISVHLTKASKVWIDAFNPKSCVVLGNN